MSQINVAEKDISWYARSNVVGSPLTIFVVGRSSSGPINEPVLCKDLRTFISTFGPVSDITDDNYRMAQSFIKAGASVLFQRVPCTDAKKVVFTWDNTDLKYTLTSKDYTEIYNECTMSCSYNVTNNKVCTFSCIVRDKNGNKVGNPGITGVLDPEVGSSLTGSDGNFELTVLVEGELSPTGSPMVSGDMNIKPSSLGAPGGKVIIDEVNFDSILDNYRYDYDASISVISELECELVNLATHKANCIHLVSGTSNMSPSEYYTYCGEGSKDCKIHSDPSDEDKEKKVFNTSYAAGVGPWGYAKYIHNGEQVLLPGTYAFLIAWIKSTNSGVPVWMAPAGVKRASLTGFYVKPQYELGKSTLDIWQNTGVEDPDHYRVNPIIRLKNYGYVVYGNSTLLHNDENGNTSALQSLSTRITSNIIKKEAFTVALGLQFDQMNNDLYVQFRTLLGAKLDEMKYQGALYDYRILLDEESVTINSLNERRLPVKIQISPAPAVEIFDISLEITKSGVTFSDETDISAE